MNKIRYILLFVLCSTLYSAQAQEKVRIRTISGNGDRLLLSDIDSFSIQKVDSLDKSSTLLPAVISRAGNLKIFSRLLKETGWADRMNLYRDFNYESSHPLQGRDAPSVSYTAVNTPSHHDYGFTALIEPDNVLCDRMNLEQPQTAADGSISNWENILQRVSQACTEYYPDAKSSDLTNEDNAVNQFVAYHLIAQSIPFNKFVIHYNEQGFGYTNSSTLGVNAWAYYTTMGQQRRLLKVTEGKTTGGLRINRYTSAYNLQNYEESVVPIIGLGIAENNGDYESTALNGHYYILNDVLYYYNNVTNMVLNERMRYDICDLLPEQMTNGFRRPANSNNISIPSGYFSNMTWTVGTYVTYLPGYQNNWPNYQGDEYAIFGDCDFTIQLPPVPFDGTYEVRIGCLNTAIKGMWQAYIGTNKDNLMAVGLPIDFRVDGNNPAIGWSADVINEEDNLATEKTMRTNGWMKAPLYFGTVSTEPTLTNFRSQSNALRKILFRGILLSGQKYYLHMKSLMNVSNTQFSLDYLEIVPKSIYDGKTVEDRW